jgi:hypothetical protein
MNGLGVCAGAPAVAGTVSGIDRAINAINIAAFMVRSSVDDDVCVTLGPVLLNE